MKPKIFIVFLIAFCALSVQKIHSQSNILYFMENVPMRNELNPAFTPTQNWYVYLPSFYTDFTTNSFTPNDFVKSINGEMKTAFDTGGDSQAFLDALKPDNHINLDTKIDLIGFGFRLQKNFFSFSVAEHINTHTNIPYDLPWLLVNGLPQTSATKDLDMKSLAMSTSAYSELGLGYSREILPNLTAGVKVKFLVGQAYAGLSFSSLSLQGNYDQSSLNGKGTISLYTPVEIPANQDGYPNTDSIKFDSKFFTQPSGSGMAVDFGAFYKPMDNLTLSFSVTDLGSITWSKNNWTAELESHTQFNDVSFQLSGENNGSLGDSLKGAFNLSQTDLKTTSKLTSHVRVGAEYGILNDKINFGLLYDYRKSSYYSDGVLTASVNFKPIRLINASVGYSLLDGRTSALSAGVNLNLGPVVLFITSDGIPLSFSEGFVPNTNYMNFHSGMIFAFGKHKKAKKINAEQAISE